jgi:DNA mismatch repair protein MutL
MPDIIKILPDSVANQIAAGEVIQRPASVVKELVENSVDAGSTKITVNIKDAGKALIQVIDDGIGMSETDARIAFERHSTSKISSANDLFKIFTKGFRGEALASIASVAQIELITKPEDIELGTKIIIEGSEFISQETVNCPKGSNFIIKNLFFNVPARRKFLKGTSTEFNHIITEFQRIAIAHPEVSFNLYHNDKEVYILPQSNLKQRLINVFGKSVNQNLTALSSKTAITNIYGYIGKPELAKKQYGQQYLFVNNRFFKNTYFHKAITLGYEHILQPDTIPAYFIFFDIAPDLIDVNIHPTKTEINFQDANAIFQLIITGVKETLSKHNVMPAIDFDTNGMIEIPNFNKNVQTFAPKIEINEGYNPFENDKKSVFDYHQKISKKQYEKQNLSTWEKLYDQSENKQYIESDLFLKNGNSDSNQNSILQFFQIKNRYILTTVKSGLMIIDQKRAHERILFDNFYNKITNTKINSQQTLYPEKIDFNSEDLIVFEEIYEILLEIGFNFEKFSSNTYSITGIPSFLDNKEPIPVLYDLIADYKEFEQDIKEKIIEKIAFSFAKSSALNRDKILTNEEMLQIFDELFSSSNPNYTYNGKPIISMLSYDEIEKKF